MLERFDKPVVTLGVNSSFTVFCIPFIFASVLLIAFVIFLPDITTLVDEKFSNQSVDQPTKIENGTMVCSLSSSTTNLDKIYDLFNFPKNWELVAQMPFGAIETEPAEKTFMPLDERLKILR